MAWVAITTLAAPVVLINLFPVRLPLTAGLVRGARRNIQDLEEYRA
jgi:hypothetical protein